MPKKSKQNATKAKKQKLPDLGLLMQALDTYHESFGLVIENTNRIISDYWRALDEFDRSGGNLTVEHTNKAGATNTEKNPLYRVIEQLRADMLVHLRELGLTPAGLKRLQREAETKQDNTLLEALAKLEGV